jgi:6-phosphogluconolactonase (cycloisomerase 2 family)
MDHRNGTLENLSQFELEEDGPISIIASNTPSMFFAISNDLSHLYTLLVKDAGLVIDHQQDLELNGFDGTFSDQLITPDGRYLFVTGGSNNESGITLAFNIDQRTTHPSFQGSIEHDFSPAQIKPIQVKSRK